MLRSLWLSLAIEELTGTPCSAIRMSRLFPVDQQTFKTSIAEVRRLAITPVIISEDSSTNESNSHRE
jgi:hypothetical protein